jgi:hypothetical protein
VPSRVERKRRRAANAIEFAMLMPVFVTIVAAIGDFGWLFFHRSAVDAAVSEGCREGAIVDPMVDDPHATAYAAMAHGIQISGLKCDEECTLSTTESGTVPNRLLVCSLTYTYQPLFGLITKDLDLYAETATRFEWQRDPPPDTGSAE